MKFSEWLSAAMFHDSDGQSGLTGLQFLIAMAFVACLFAYCIVADRRHRREGHYDHE